MLFNLQSTHRGYVKLKCHVGLYTNSCNSNVTKKHSDHNRKQATLDRGIMHKSRGIFFLYTMTQTDDTKRIRCIRIDKYVLQALNTAENKS